MKYIINEYQSQDESSATAIVTPQQTNDYYEAESIYYAKLSAAAISTVPYHTITLEQFDGFRLMQKCYDPSRFQNGGGNE